MWALQSPPDHDRLAPGLFWFVVILLIVWWVGKKRRRR